MVFQQSTQVDLMQRKSIDLIANQEARTKEERRNLRRDSAVRPEEEYLKPTPRPLLTRLSPHRNKTEEISVPVRLGIVQSNQGERRVPLNPTSYHRDPPSLETPLQSEREPYLAGTPEEEEEEEEEGVEVRAQDPKWSDYGVCGTPDTEDSDIYCSEEKDRIGFAAGTNEEEVDVVCDDDSGYSFERVFVNQYLSNSMSRPDHMLQPSVKTSTSMIAGNREEGTGDVSAVGSIRSKDTKHYLRSTLNVSSASVKSFTNKSSTLYQDTEHCPMMITTSSEPTLRWENAAQQLDNQLRKARLTFASLRDEIKSDL
jgi:hypothetical protein